MRRTHKVLLLSLILAAAGCGFQAAGTGQSAAAPELTVTYYYLPG